jgi:hypothetical protein
MTEQYSDKKGDTPRIKDIDIKIFNQIGEIGLNRLERYARYLKTGSGFSQEEDPLRQDDKDSFVQEILNLYQEDVSRLGKLSKLERGLYLEAHMSLASLRIMQDTKRTSRIVTALEKTKIPYNPRLEEKLIDIYLQFNPALLDHLVSIMGELE